MYSKGLPPGLQGASGQGGAGELGGLNSGSLPADNITIIIIIIIIPTTSITVKCKKRFRLK